MTTKLKSLLAGGIVVFAVSTTALLLVVVGGEPDDVTKPKTRPAETTPGRKRPSPAVTKKAPPKRKQENAKASDFQSMDATGFPSTPAIARTKLSAAKSPRHEVPIVEKSPSEATASGSPRRAGGTTVATLPPRPLASPNAVHSTPSRKPTIPSRPTKTVPPAKPVPGQAYWIQVGAFSSETNAKSLSRRLEAAGFEVSRLQQPGMRGRILKVLVRSGTTKEAATKDIEKLRREFGLSGLIVSRPGRR